MIKVVSTEHMRQIEAAADAGGLSYADMMQNAGRAVANRVIAALSTLTNPEEARITVLVGPGNNGGDGLAAARHLHEADYNVRVWLLPATKYSPDFILNRQRLPKDLPLAFLCHHGSRSAAAAERFRQLGFTRLYNVEGGIDAWSQQVDAAVPRY